MMNCMHTLSLTREDYEVIVAIADEMSVTRCGKTVAPLAIGRQSPPAGAGGADRRTPISP